MDIIIIRQQGQCGKWICCLISENKACVGVPAPRRLRFSPPAENFTLCHYSASRLQELPIFGSFTMKVKKIIASESGGPFTQVKLFSHEGQNSLNENWGRGRGPVT